MVVYTKTMNHHQHHHRLLYNWLDKQDDVNDNAPLSKLARLKEEDTVLFIWFVTAIVCSSIFVIWVAKWYLQRRFGIQCCSRNSREQRWIISRDAAIATTQRIRDAAIAAEQERKLDEAARKVELKRKRDLLSDVTTIVEEGHLESDQDALEALEEGTNQQIYNDDEEDAIVLHIPGQRRTFAECRICLANFAAGDAIIHSPNPDCIHVFHDTCILNWLSESKAKSDCPCCRLPFIPKGYDDAGTDKQKDFSSTDDSSASAGDSTDTAPSSDESQSSSSDTVESEGFDEEEEDQTSV